MKTDQQIDVRPDVRPVRADRWPRVALVAAALVLLCVAALAFSVQRTQAPAAPAWSAVGSPHSLVHALVRAPWGTLYAGTSQAVYSSADGGATWRPLGQGLPRTAFEAWSVTAASTRGDDVVLVATGDGKVYRLARSGGSWTQAGRPIGTFAVYAVYALPRSDVVLAGSDRGIFRSSDGGRTWTAVAPLGGESAGVTSFVRDPTSGAVYAGLAGMPRPLRVSVDGGRTWRVPTTPLPPPSVEALLATSGHVYAGVMGAPGGRAVWAGRPGGFTAVATGLPATAHGMALATAHNRLLVGTMGIGVYSRTGSGVWTRLGPGPADGLVTSLLVLPGAHPVVLAGTDSGVYRMQLP